MFNLFIGYNHTIVANETMFEVSVFCVGGVINQSVPIVLPVSNEDKDRLSEAEALALRHKGEVVAIMRKVRASQCNQM